MTAPASAGGSGLSTGVFAVLVILLAVLCPNSVSSQDTNRTDLPDTPSHLDSLSIDSIEVDSTIVPAVPLSYPRPDVLPRFTLAGSDGVDHLSRMVLQPHASFTELLLDRGLFGVNRTSTPTFPSAFAFGSSGPGSVPLLYDGTLLETEDGVALEPLWVPLFRAGEIEYLRGVDASLYAGASARAGVHVLPQSFDVEGSYIRFGYTGAPGDVSRVAVLFARNIGDDMGITFNFRRTPGSDINLPSDNANIIGGDIALDYFPDDHSRVTARAEVQELDRMENGGLARESNAPVIDGITEEGRRRRLSVTWVREGRAEHIHDTTEVESLADTIDAGLLSPWINEIGDPAYRGQPDHSLVTGSFYYQHAGRTLLAGATILQRSIDDIFGLSGSLTRSISSTTYLRSHLQAGIADGEQGRIHVASLFGIQPSAIGVEVGAALTGRDIWKPALLAGVHGRAGRIGWAIDGRYYPGANDEQPEPTGYLTVDTLNSEALISNWIVEGRTRYLFDEVYVEIEGGIRGVVFTTSGETGTALDAAATLRLPVGPFTVSGSGRTASASGLAKLFPAIRGEMEVGYAFDLLRGALDIYTAVRGEAAGSTGGFRYDPIRNLWYSLPEDRATPVRNNPFLSGVLTARIGTAFFSFELTNLLNAYWWTVRRRPYSGFGLRFGLTWGLVD